ncbi:16S rRNA (guanine527-N7)-methyltransferase [Clostridium tetanomorphum]|uniref:Ribosomal RNA small subunit methyltransferase G n=1 Tax=Clostridium tetanomorphum TaxID=1553 RepID=A0A923EDY1_CLOTT|nr:16S rRNA (guanine(527)-N(7))-methyltransferase RsmG [Clostridium tetanomorphum]KAJ49561.1 16S rRNA methyltransferase GidB [Clostridium tetanomorphum DSM 665]KAJ50020.1 16S rRNA methyltransferase GidB [Clostridium tetanomorphum DSM 665]MBC2399003.1 16S rRNA (guanine(527)-N(7))-methyltransferase RsmG [Clostridium tetanomorphum]MBP1866209.1 16S rRNA (guanine527-N7)-methyltransferase [Clostridium tetanomorphum]NRS86599.1 16S rRNA (guanine527-N7)-methyltransferase [Clostridium tetanomorphum]
MQYYDLLSSACKDVNIEFDEGKYNRFIKYKDLIKEWNEKINLTAITEDEAIIKKHFIDSIKIYKFSPLKECKKVIDIGTGAGFPGIPMKIVDENKEFTLLDSLNKRIKFLDEVISQLQINNINTLHGRAEDFSKKDEYREKFDAVVSRAVANIAVLSEFCIPYVKVGGYFVAMKGPSVEEEIKEGKKAIDILGGKIEQIVKVEIEESDLQHNLVVIKKIKNTPTKYPRKAGAAAKNPIK